MSARDPWRAAFRPVLLAAIVLLGAGAACMGSISEPELPDLPEFTEADLRVLYVGNSLTYTNDIPGLVQALANAGGKSVSQIAITAPNFSLEDHWQQDIAFHIRRLEPDVIVMQQGPSSLAASRAHLVLWSGRIAAVGREVGAEPALLMVWPESWRLAAFPDVAYSYANAANAIGGLLIPAGGTWLEAWEHDASLPFYGPDAFHPSYLGALAAAQTIYSALFNANPATIPRLNDGVPLDQLAILHAAVAASLQRQWLASTPPF